MLVNFRIDKEDWEDFKAMCRAKDLTCSQVLRSFIREQIGGQNGFPIPIPEDKGMRELHVAGADGEDK